MLLGPLPKQCQTLELTFNAHVLLLSSKNRSIFINDHDMITVVRIFQDEITRLRIDHISGSKFY